MAIGLGGDAPGRRTRPPSLPVMSVPIGRHWPSAASSSYRLRHMEPMPSEVCVPHAVRAGDLVITSAAAPVDWRGSVVAAGDAAAQGAAVFDRALAAAAAHGAGLDDVVQTRMHLTAAGDPAVEVRGSVFRTPRPASLGIGLRRLCAPGAAIECAVVASLAAERDRVPDRSAFGQMAGYSRAVRAGDRVWLTGTTASSGEGVCAPGDPAGQVAVVADRLRAALATVGASPADLVLSRCYVTDPAHVAPVEEAHAREFAAAVPAGGLVEVVEFGPPGHLVKIEGEAHLGGWEACGGARPDGRPAAARAGADVHVSLCHGAGPDAATAAAAALASAAGALAAARAGLADVMQVQAFVLDPADGPAVRMALAAGLPGCPAVSVVPASGLAAEGARVAVDLRAVLAAE